jgi:hypothetical protein
MRDIGKNTIRALALVLAWFGGVLAGPSAAQGAVQVSARLSAGVLRLGDTGALNLTVENADDARVLEVPAVTGLRFGKPGQPMSQRYTGFVNGRRYAESNLTIAIPFRTEAEGDFEIPSVSVEVQGQRYQTKPLRITVVKDITGADFGYLEVRASGTKVVEGQPFTVELAFGWDEERTGKVTFAELNLPWWDSLPGAIEVAGQPIPQASRVDIPVNGSLQVPAEQLENRVRDGRTFIQLRLTKSFLPTRSGTLEFPTSFFEFGRLRQTSFFDSRRESHFVQAPSFLVEVVALPSEGQPLDFSGAVGTLAARASADTRDVRAGDSIKFTVEWTGQGNLEYFRAPDPGALEAFRGFRVYGATEEKSFERRKVIYDLAPLSSDVQSIPALPLTFFDPARGSYETVATTPIPIRVRALEKGERLADDERRFERDIADIDARAPVAGTSAEEGHGEDRFLLAALVVVPLVGLSARARARARAGDPGAPLERRRRRAARALARALARADDPAGQLAALHEFLAARTREHAEAWNGRDLVRWAAARAPGLPHEVVREAAQALAGLEAAVYGGGAPPAREKIGALARTLQEAGL